MTTSRKKSAASGSNSKILSGPEQVIEYLKDLEHPLKKEIEEVRKIILSANVHISEHIKWNSPSFCYNNEDRITINLHNKDYFLLVFHRGAKANGNKGKEPLFDDATGLLEWVSGDRAAVKLTDMSDVKSKEHKLVQVVAKWIEVTSD